MAETLEKITGYFGKRRPGIDRGHVSDSIQQILEASCLEFENRPDDAAPSSEPWEKRVKLKSSIDDPRSLLRSIDYGSQVR